MVLCFQVYLLHDLGKKDVASTLKLTAVYSAKQVSHQHPIKIKVYLLTKYSFSE